MSDDIRESLLDAGFESIGMQGNCEVYLKSQYMDDGYGFYFDAEVKVFVDGDRYGVLIDGENEGKIQRVLAQESENCPFMKKCGECKDSMLCDDVDASGIDENEHDCSRCTEYTMKDSWISMYLESAQF